MKKLQSIEEGVWKEIVKVELTDEEKELIKSMSVEDKEAKKSLMERIKSERELDVDEEITVIAQSIYESNKPELKETDKYQLIAVDMAIDEESAIGGGIINCRVNGEHKQIRF